MEVQFREDLSMVRSMILSYMCSRGRCDVGLEEETVVLSCYYPLADKEARSHPGSCCLQYGDQEDVVETAEDRSKEIRTQSSCRP